MNSALLWCQRLAFMNYGRDDYLGSSCRLMISWRSMRHQTGMSLVTSEVLQVTVRRSPFEPIRQLKSAQAGGCSASRMRAQTSRCSNDLQHCTITLVLPFHISTCSVPKSRLPSNPPTIRRITRTIRMTDRNFHQRFERSPISNITKSSSIFAATL